MKINSKVKVKNFGSCYTTYSTMFEKMGFKNTVMNKCSSDWSDRVFTVFSIDEHETYGDLLLGIRDDFGNELLIGKDGVTPYVQPFEITKEQILKLDDLLETTYLQDWFPEAFKPALEDGKWELTLEQRLERIEKNLGL